MPHITPSLSKTAGSRKLAEVWNREFQVLIARFITLRIRAYLPLPHPLILSKPALFSGCCVIRRRNLTSGRGRSPVTVETRICTAMENGHERGLRRIREACEETNTSRRTNSEHRNLNIIIYHFQCGIIYFTAREIFQQNIRKYF